MDGHAHDIEHESLVWKELRLRQHRSLNPNPKRVCQNERDEDNHSAREYLGNKLGLRGYETLHEARSDPCCPEMDETYGEEVGNKN